MTTNPALLEQTLALLDHPSGVVGNLELKEPVLAFARAFNGPDRHLASGCGLGGSTRACAAVLFLLTGITSNSQASAEVPCQQLTPLPPDARVVTPTDEVPNDIARFSGAWSGAWQRAKDPRWLCTALVVEELHPNGFTRVIYSHGYQPQSHVRYPDYFRAIGRVTDGELRFPTPWGGMLTYRANGGELHVANRRADKAVVSRTELPQIGCPQLSDASGLDGQPPDKRDAITSAELGNPAYAPVSPLHNGYFGPLGESDPPLHPFEGELTIADSLARTARHGCRGADLKIPQFTLGFMTIGDDLVPRVRDIIHPPGTVGDVTFIVSPGKVWSEGADVDMSRAAFPFAVTSRYSNKTHNGLATFLYNENTVSALRFQVVQETASWQRIDVWGQSEIGYSPGPIPGREPVARRFELERAAAWPLRPWEELSHRLTPELSEDFAGAWAREHVSATGLVVDGVIYMPPCKTRFGNFPYCRHMRHGAFSVTKSMGAAVTLLRLARKYGADVFDLKIKDFVAITANHKGWDDVSFGDALNMAVGVGDRSAEPFPLDIGADSEGRSKRFRAWLREPTRTGKLRLAFSFPNYPWGPGTIARYDTTHTFVLGAAMDAFYKSREGPDADLWSMVRKEVLEPIGVFHAPVMRTVSLVEPDATDSGRELPIFGFGLYPTVEDAAKIATLLQNEGRHDGEMLLHSLRTREALYRTTNKGLPTGGENRYGPKRYHQSFWSEKYEPWNGCSVQIPYMAGFGGNLVVLMPNGISAIRFADGHNYEIEPMVLAAERIAPFCAPPIARSVSDENGEPPLKTESLRALVAGSTMYSRNGAKHHYYAPDGTVYAGSGEQHWLGTWTIDRDRLCTRWSTRRSGIETCYELFRDGDSILARSVDSWRVLRLEHAEGNPEGY